MATNYGIPFGDLKLRPPKSNEIQTITALQMARLDFGSLQRGQQLVVTPIPLLHRVTMLLRKHLVRIEWDPHWSIPADERVWKSALCGFFRNHEWQMLDCNVKISYVPTYETLRISIPLKRSGAEMYRRISNVARDLWAYADSVARELPGAIQRVVEFNGRME